MLVCAGTKKLFALLLPACYLDAVAFNGIGLICGEEMGEEAFCIFVRIFKNGC